MEIKIKKKKKEKRKIQPKILAFAEMSNADVW